MQHSRIHEAVHDHATRTPRAPAVVHDEFTITYGELDRRSAELAAILAQCGVAPGAVVAVLLRPSAELIVALLAVLRCGAAYSALDPNWPVGRLRRILEILDGQPVITDTGRESFGAGRRVLVGADGSDVADVGSRSRPIVSENGDAAMVFFTSGSTGEPKAVLSPHRATLRLFDGCTFARFDRDTVMIQSAAVPWDAFALELWGPLTTGGSAVLVTARPLTPDGLRHAIGVHRANTAFMTTSLFHLFIEEDVNAFTGLRTLIVGGERLSARHAGELLAAQPDLRLVNGYGPVESAVFALTHDVRPADTTGEVPLGRPVPRTEVLITRPDAPDRLCAEGETGEICVAGDGLAVGYLGDPALTAAKFHTIPVDGSSLRVYRTGDLGRRTADGVVHFHGRLDRQVKVRGNRIEPAGVESAAAAVPGVRRCVVAVRPDDTGNADGLQLFYLATGGRPTVAELEARLRAVLPSFAVPDRIVAVDRFPLSPTGKVDVNALVAESPATSRDGDRQPEVTGVASTVEVVAAEVAALVGNAVDKTLSVFAQGLTSMSAVRLCSRLGKRFGRVVPISRLMSAGTVTKLAAWLDEPRPPTAASDGHGPAGVPATPMQQSFVLHEMRLRSASPANHCVLRWRLTGPVDEERLVAALSAVHRRHDALRAAFELGDELTVRASEEDTEIIRFEVDDGGPARTQVLERLHRPFDLMSGRVWRAVLARDSSRECWELGVAVHHAVFDGWSEHVLAHEISAAYAGTAEPGVPDLAATYRSLVDVASAADLAGQAGYWTGATAGLTPIVWPPAAADGSGARWLEFPLDDEMDGIRARAAQSGTTVLAVLLDAVGRALFDATANDDVGVGVPVSLRVTEPLQRPVGCLVDTVCVRLHRERHGPRTAAAAAAVAMTHADLPFAEVVRLARPPRTGRHPLYQVIAAVQDSPAPCLRLPGVTVHQDAKDDLPWTDIELVVELFCGDGEAPRLRVSRDPRVVDLATLRAVAAGVRHVLHARAEVVAEVGA
ncbi:MAG: amino acid adenylation domain-containing protein [Actinophytocola sp.]|uniref:amino acid adenylation domain-containing protein n=1 Tax=Actinophytocola sp. TaxID=1872138 RepID=UPI003D6A0A78